MTIEGMEGVWVRHSTGGITVAHLFFDCPTIRFAPERNELMTPEQAIHMGYRRACYVCEGLINRGW